MECLGQSEAIRANIKAASTAAIRSLHKFIFHNEGDRNNRQRLRDFKGFSFAINSEEYTAQLEYAGRLTIGELISSCNVLGIDFTGSKEEIIIRICNALIDLNLLVRPNDEEEEGEKDDEKSTADEMGMNSGSERDFEPTFAQRQRRDVSLCYSIEDEVKAFDGSNAYPWKVEKWIEEFEEAAEFFQWTELQKLIFAKISLSGPAKLFIQSERGINSWCKLKSALKKEFVSKANSAEIHMILSERKLLPHDSVQEYYLALKELAARGSVEEEVLIQYIVLGATTLEEVKQRLSTYEKIREKCRERNDSYKRTTQANKEFPTNQKAAEQPANSSKMDKSEIRCFICGKKGHHENNCDVDLPKNVIV